MKKAKALALEKNRKKQLAIMFTAPILIALALFVFSAAHAWGNTNDYRLSQRPDKQGWDQLKHFESKNDHADSKFSNDTRVNNTSLQ